MRSTLRRLSALATAFCAFNAFPAYAQDDSRAIRLIVATAPGTSPDASARFFAERLAGDLKAPVIVENRVGANGIIATEFVSKAAPDGRTFLFGSSTHHINATLYKLRFDPIKDFTPVVRYADALLVFVVAPSAPFNSINDLVDYARANPGKVTYASAGSGSLTHLAPAQFAKLKGLDMVHIPYKGADQALVDTMSGQVTFNVTSIASAAGQIKAGKLKPLAVTGLVRSVSLPDVPTMAEFGMPGYEIVSKLGVLAPASTPPDVVERMAAAVARAADSKEFRARAAQLGIEVSIAGPAQYGAEAKPQIEKWAEIVKSSGAKIE